VKANLPKPFPQEAQYHGVYLRPLLQALLQVLPTSQGAERLLRGLVPEAGERAAVVAGALHQRL